MHCRRQDQHFHAAILGLAGGSRVAGDRALIGIADHSQPLRIHVRLTKLSGNRDTSRKYFRELLSVCAHADKPARSELEEAEQSILQK